MGVYLAECDSPHPSALQPKAKAAYARK